MGFVFLNAVYFVVLLIGEARGVLALVAYRLSRRNLLVAVAVGVGAMMAIAAVRG